VRHIITFIFLAAKSGGRAPDPICLIIATYGLSEWLRRSLVPQPRASCRSGVLLCMKNMHYRKKLYHVTQQNQQNNE
jgi:hypothetical protein